MGSEVPLQVMHKPPATHEGLTRAVQARFDALSRGYQQIARYLIQNPNEVAIQSVSVVAERCGVHASSLVRFAQSFGYSGFKELQAIFHARLATAAPMCLSQALMIALAARLETGERVPRIPVATESQK